MKGSIVVSGATDTIGVTLAAAEGVKTVNTFGLETVNTFGVPITPDPICLT